MYSGIKMFGFLTRARFLVSCRKFSLTITLSALWNLNNYSLFVVGCHESMRACNFVMYLCKETQRYESTCGGKYPIH